LGRRIRVFAITTVLAVATWTGDLRAEPVWPTTVYDYVVVDQDLRAVLQQFGVNTGLRLALSDKVQGRVHGPLPSAPPREFLNNLAQQFGLDWTFDGSIIWISATSEAQTQMLPMQGVGFDRLKASLTGAGLLEPRFQLRPAANNTIAVVSGPPHYNSIVQQALTALAAEKAPPEPAPAHKSVVLMRGAASTRVDFP
jgi:type III secretion protein C